MSSDSPSVVAYDDLVNDAFENFYGLSQSIGGQVKMTADMVKTAVQMQRQFLVTVSKSRQPAQDALINLLKPTSQQIEAILEYREKNRTSDVFNHLSAISESISALGWVTISPTPAPYVKEMNDASQFYTNKILVAYKEKDKRHVDWAKAWVNFLSQLQLYVKQHHTTGLVWNAKGSDVTSNGAPPPPPLPPGSFFLEGGEKMDNDEKISALLKDLNVGTDITKSLKKVTSDMQTHKNPGLRNQTPSTKSPMQGAQGRSVAPKGPPKFELDGKRWIIENHVGKKDLVVNGTAMSQTVNIYKCHDCLVTVKGKLNSIVVDSCNKFAVIFDDIISSVEFVNCQNVQTQSTGAVPTINVDKTDVAQIYLSEKSTKAEIITAKSSSVNVSVFNPTTGDYMEHPIPEQFKSVWTGKGFKTLPADIAV